MAGDKARAATQGIREMLMECQARGPAGPDRSYFQLLLIAFDNVAVIDPLADMAPVRRIDPDRITITGHGGGTNITGALQLALQRLRPYMDGLHEHAERAEHPVPLVLLFSDGEHNDGPPPQPVAAQIKNLTLDGEPVVIATAGVAIGGQRPDEKTLMDIASPGCYFSVTQAPELSRFISSVGSSGASRPRDIAQAIQRLQY
jgi:uncharacterized protein YegL